jgi:hypothetical protein
MIRSCERLVAGDKREWKRTGIGGLVGYLEWLALHYPATAAPILAKAIGMQISFVNEDEVSEQVEYETIEEVQQAMRERGLTDESLKLSLEHQPQESQDDEGD